MCPSTTTPWRIRSAHWPWVAVIGYSWAPAGARAAVMLSLIESAKLNGHDLWAYLKDVFERLPTLKNRDLASLLPHNWKPADKAQAPTVPTAASAVTGNAGPSAARQHSRHCRRKMGWRNAYTLKSLGHRPEHAQPSRPGRHRLAPQRQATQIAGLEAPCRAVPAPRLIRLPGLLGNYHQPRCTWRLNAPTLNTVLTN